MIKDDLDGNGSLRAIKRPREYRSRRGRQTVGDFLIFFTILVIALLLIAFQFMPLFKRQADALYVDGPDMSLVIQADEYSGVAGRRWDLPGDAGGLTLAYTPDKGFHVESASCPDQVCVRSGFINRAGQSIVCVPNQIIISLRSGAAGEGGGELDGLLR